MRIAIISDIHGNQIALEAVLADIKRTGVDQIICLGDIANVGPHPVQCLDIIRDLNCPVLQGNHELYLLGRFENDDWRTSPIWAGMRWTRSQLRPDQFDYLEKMPLRYEIAGNGRARAVFVHGTPSSQYRGFLPKHDDKAIGERMNGLDNVTLFCGHTHIPLYRPWSNSWLVNTGSLGMPIDGTPTAKYVIASQQKHEWHIEFRMIEYNIEKVIADYDAVGLQQAGGKITAIFRYQMQTGQPLALQFFYEMHQRAKANNSTPSAVFEAVPVPPQVQQWCNGQRIFHE